MIVYHGSITVVKKPLVTMGRKNLDFGQGFYVTTLRQQAIDWALRPINLRSEHWLNIYEFDEPNASDDNYRILKFEAYDESWFSFILNSRKGGTDYMGYDLIEGGIANDRVFNTIELYMNGLIPYQEALNRLKYEKPNQQICFISQKLLDEHVKFIDAERISFMVENALINKTLLQMKYVRVIELLAQRLQTDSARALEVFYSTRVYQYLSNLQYSLHNMGDAYIVDEIMIELENGY